MMMMVMIDDDVQEACIQIYVYSSVFCLFSFFVFVMLS